MLSSTAQNVLSLAVYEYLGTTDASKPNALGNLVSYLEEERKAVIVDFTISQPQSLIITVEYSSLQKLEELWHDYSTEHLNKMVHKYLVTRDILDELALANLKLATTISEEEYRFCRMHFLQSLGEHRLMHDNLFHLLYLAYYILI